MAKCTASSASFLWGDDTAIAILASPTGTTLKSHLTQTVKSKEDKASFLWRDDTAIAILASPTHFTWTIKNKKWIWPLLCEGPIQLLQNALLQKVQLKSHLTFKNKKWTGLLFCEEMIQILQYLLLPQTPGWNHIWPEQFKKKVNRVSFLWGDSTAVLILASPGKRYNTEITFAKYN